MQLRPLTLFGILISMVTGVMLGVTGYRAYEVEAPSPAASAFSEVLDQVAASYVDEVAEERLLDGALRGMLGELDAHSNFLDDEALGHLQEETTGEFGGIGIELALLDGFFTVVAPLDDTPAARAGLAAGDRLIALDARPLKGRRLTEVISELRGPPGSRVALQVMREGADEPLGFVLERAVIATASVSTRLLDKDYGYARIAQFQTHTGRDFRDALEALRAEAGGQLAGLVLDLRNNPGGVLQASVGVVDALLDDGLIVSTRGRMPSSRLKFRASGGDLLDGAPVVVLINRGSASAAEIVAGALQDHGRAQLLGSRSYGKGSVQSLVPLRDHGALKLTTAYYYTPAGRNIHEAGIEPDVALDSVAAASEDKTLARALGLLKDGAGGKGALHAAL